MKLSVFPNPASAITCIPVSVSHKTQATIFLVDLLGQHTSIIFEGELPTGESNYFIDASQYPSGAYNIVLQTALRKVNTKTYNSITHMNIQIQIFL